MNMMAMCTQTMSQRMNNSQASKSTDSGYYGSNENKFTSPPPSARYNTGMGNTSSYTGIGGNTSSTGMGQGNMSGMMGQQGNTAYSGMGNTSRGGGGPGRGGMGANRGNPY